MNKQLSAAACAAGMVLAACGGDQTVIVDRDNHTNSALRYTTVETGIWPPQPADISNPREYINNNPSTGVREIKNIDAVNNALLNTDVIAAIGTRHELLATYTTGDKSAQQLTTELELFNYDTNEVVTVLVDPDSTVSITRAPAYEYQPAESAAEVSTANRLAADYLNNHGHDTEGLIGTALLAHPSQAEVAASEGRTFYAHRIIYVTFGEGSGKTPRYRATVDLSEQTVIRGGSL